MFDGRLNEDFKLSSGTWVSVGPLRAELLRHLHDLAQDVVITGPDRDVVGLLIFPNLARCRAIASCLPDAPDADVVADPAVQAAFARALESFTSAHAGSSRRIARALVLDTPPSFELGESTDKGSLNQKAVARLRAPLVDELHAPHPTARVILIES